MKNGEFRRCDMENDPMWMRDADPSGNKVEDGNVREMILGKE